MKVTRESLQVMINSADAVKKQHIVGRALVAIFNRQTMSEKNSNITNNWNTVGFSGADAYSGCLTAKSYLKHKSLQEWQVQKWLKPARNGFARLTKYHKQLNEIAMEKAA